MSAQDNLNPQQLAMFVPAKELVSSDYTPGDFPNPNPAMRKRGWENKLSESKSVSYARNNGASDGKTLHETIKTEGIDTPVDIWHRDNAQDGSSVGEVWDSTVPAGPEIANGHHRVAIAHDIDPNYLVPVMHEDRKSSDYLFNTMFTPKKRIL